MKIPEGYNHKATSDSHAGVEGVVIYHSNDVDRYLVVFSSAVDEDVDDAHVFINKQQLELLIQSSSDTLEMDSR